MAIFKEKLKELRVENKLSQRELAEILNVSQRSISSWEHGDREPNYEMLATISKFFKVSTDYLLGLEN